MYEEKHQELLSAKEKLGTLTAETEKKTMQIELMSSHIAKLNQRIKVTQHLSRPEAGGKCFLLALVAARRLPGYLQDVQSAVTAVSAQGSWR